ncbi:hypothetical protein O9K51_04141 [Purpureocillium lavendulum]|uniref:Uncharacterized protein n=1 Tax=Purpureocillium lavendulum TaxID=1247861 RepID=A0AB34FUF2_9HYPO|nr:hypothetical protein O9K51_04141 [Purpureocillium lavendulum]
MSPAAHANVGGGTNRAEDGVWGSRKSVSRTLQGGAVGEGRMARRRDRQREGGVLVGFRDRDHAAQQHKDPSLTRSVQAGKLAETAQSRP